jgi:hypothetical protein
MKFRNRQEGLELNETHHLLACANDVHLLAEKNTQTLYQTIVSTSRKTHAGQYVHISTPECKTKS